MFTYIVFDMFRYVALNKIYYAKIFRHLKTVWLMNVYLTFEHVELDSQSMTQPKDLQSHMLSNLGNVCVIYLVIYILKINGPLSFFNISTF